MTQSLVDGGTFGLAGTIYGQLAQRLQAAAATPPAMPALPTDPTDPTAPLDPAAGASDTLPADSTAGGETA